MHMLTITPHSITTTTPVKLRLPSYWAVVVAIAGIARLMHAVYDDALVLVDSDDPNTLTKALYKMPDGTTKPVLTLTYAEIN